VSGVYNGQVERNKKFAAEHRGVRHPQNPHENPGGIVHSARLSRLHHVGNSG